MKISKPYYVSRENTTSDEPNPGWYFSVEDDDMILCHGAFRDKYIAEQYIEELEEE